mmetsp:Transcript_51489/g.130060  ORF Transcript_51489/g.130060 Transcript_51489/m.130060 type:complete len:261 (+) Transcript_51489:808-1590(+)
MKEDQRCATLAADLYEVRRFDSRLAEEHAVVGKDANGVALNVRPAANHGRTVFGFELMEARAIHDACDHLPDVIRNVRVLGDNAKQTLLVVQRRFRSNAASKHRARRAACKVLDDFTAHCKRRILIGCKVVASPGLRSVHHGTAQTLLVRIFASGRLDQGRASEIDCPIVLHNDGLIAHRWCIGAASCAHTTNNGDLRDAHGAHASLVVELPATFNELRRQCSLERHVPVRVLLVLPHIALGIQLGATAIDQVDARQVVD